MFNQLVTPSGTKIAQSAADLARYAETDVESIEPVLLDLEKARILRQDGTRYEIFHDVLAGAVLQWRTITNRSVASPASGGAAASWWLVSRRRLSCSRSRSAWRSSPSSSGRARRSRSGRPTRRPRMRKQVSLVQSRPRTRRRRSATSPKPARRGGLSRRRRPTRRSRSCSQRRQQGATREPTDQAANALRRALGQPSEVPFPGEPHEGDVTSISASRNGELLVTTGVDGTARIWDARKGDVRKVLEGHEDAVVSSSASADGSRLATGGDDGTVRIWDTRTGRTIRVIRELGAIVSVALSPDGGLLATATAYGEGGVWDSITGTSLVRLNGRLVAAVVRGAGGLVDPDVGRVTAVAFDPGGSGWRQGRPEASGSGRSAAGARCIRPSVRRQGTPSSASRSGAPARRGQRPRDRDHLRPWVAHQGLPGSPGFARRRRHERRGQS